MRKVPISKLRTYCNKLLREIEETRVPIEVTKHGKTLANIVPIKQSKHR